MIPPQAQTCIKFPEIAGVPGVPGIPGVPGVSGAPGMSGIPGISGAHGVSGVASASAFFFSLESLEYVDSNSPSVEDVSYYLRKGIQPWKEYA